jgi:ribose transport system substrate-binding protein
MSQKWRARTPLCSALVLILIIAAGVLLTACGGGGSSSSSSEAEATTEAKAEENSETEEVAEESEGSGGGEVAVWSEGLTEKVSESSMQKLIDNVIAPGFEVSKLPSWSIEPFEVAAQKVTPEEEKKVDECLKETTCQTGHGEYSIALADSFGGNGWRRQFRALFTLALLRYPSVKEITYTDGNAELPKIQSNFRSLIAQHVNAIVGIFDFGDAMLPVVKQAAAAGIPVVGFSQGIPSDPGDGSVQAQYVGIDSCEQGKLLGEAAVAEGSSGTVAMYTGTPGNPFAAEWEPCTKEAVESAGWKMTTEGNTNWTPQGEAEQASALLSKGLPNSVVYDYTPQVFIEEFSKGGKPPTFAGGSATFGAYTAWEETGKPEAFTITSQNGYGYVAAALALADAAEETPSELPFDALLPVSAPNFKELGPYFYKEVPSEAVFNSGLPPAIMKAAQGG